MIKKIKRFPTFLKEVQGELRKVNWSTRQELISATYIVIVASSILTIYIAGIDRIFAKIMEHFLR